MMDMKISGSGQIPAGEYDHIRVSGSGQLHGAIRCTDLHCSGSTKSDGRLECKNELEASGSCKFEESVKAGSIRTSGAFSCGKDVTVESSLHSSGSLKCGGSLTVREIIRISGSANCAGSLKCGDLKASGSLKIGKDAEAEKIFVSGMLHCEGLLNAEQIDIQSDFPVTVGSIGGSEIRIRPALPRTKNLLDRLCFWKKEKSSVTVQQSIEGDQIELEYVVAPRVSGRIVMIGDGCNIDLVQYSEQVEISPQATVGRLEKTEH